MKIRIVEPIRKNGALFAVVLELQESKDIDIYRSFLRSEPALVKCPHCGKPVDANFIKPLIQVDSPLSESVMKLAAAVVNCPECDRRIEGISMMDYSAFASVNAFLRELRAKAAAKKRMEAANGKR